MNDPIIVGGSFFPWQNLSYAQQHFDEYPMWSADSVLNKGPTGSSRKSNVHAKVKRNEQSKSRKLNRGKK